MDTDRVYRCHFCSYATWQERRRAEKPNDPMDDPVISSAFDEYVNERGNAATGY